MSDEWIKQESQLWTPEKEGDSLIGKLTQIEDGKYGPKYHILKDDGKETITNSYKVLISRMAAVKEGDRVKIVFMGKEANRDRGKNDTYLFDVFTAKPPPTQTKI